MVAIGTVMFTRREHIIAVEARGTGMLGVTLRYQYEIRKEGEYFDGIPDETVPKDMLVLASHIIVARTARFKPDKFQDHYENALKALLKKKQAGRKVERVTRREAPKVVNLMDALRRSVKSEKRTPARPKRSRKQNAEQTEMLFPVPGKKSSKAASRNTVRPRASKRAG